MRTYEYKAYNAGGQTRKGLVEAFNEKEARERLAAQSLFPISLQEAGTGRKRNRSAASDESVRSMLYREMAVLLRAGLPLSGALQLLTETPELAAQRTLLAQTHDAVRQGDSLARALERASFSRPLESALVEVGERTGALAEALFRLADYLEEQSRLRERVKTALIYPAFVIGMSLLILLFMLGFMMPRFTRMFAEARIALPPFTIWTFAAGRVAGYALLVLGLLLPFGGALHRHLCRTREDWKERADRSLFRLPLFGRARTALVNMRFARTLALVLQSGVPLTDGLELAARATGSPWLEELMALQCERVRHGQSLAAALRAIPPLSGALPGWVQAGEASGDLATMLEEAGERYRLQWDRMVTRFLAILEPVLILAIGVTVLVIALAVLMPVLSLNQAIGG